jgi:hypothetical protein
MTCECMLFQVFDKCYLKEHMMMGAYFKLIDNGDLYKKLKKAPCAKKTSCSSHKSTESQYRCTETEASLLYGILYDDDHKKYYTWFQFERYPVSCCHCFTWVFYKITGFNVGPKGTSEYTEKYPLVLNFKRFHLKTLFI